MYWNLLYAIASLIYVVEDMNFRINYTVIKMYISSISTYIKCIAAHDRMDLDQH